MQIKKLKAVTLVELLVKFTVPAPITFAREFTAVALMFTLDKSFATSTV